MANDTNQPTNYNALSNLGFRFYIKRAPTLNYFTQSVNIPGVY
jgi:hypothetical protein